MNKSKIEWCDHTFNPITGCRHGCEYCYARRMTARFSGDIRLNKMCKAEYRMIEAEDGSGPLYILDRPMVGDTGNMIVYPFGFEPTYHRYRYERLDTLKMGNNIFVGAMADVFGDWVPDEWISEMFAELKKRSVHNYIFLTKNPERYTRAKVPIADNMWYGTSITCDRDASRFNYLPAFCNTFVSIEPLHGDIANKHSVMFRQVKWIIIGAETGNRKNKVTPLLSWVLRICKAADAEGIPIFMKDSLIPIVGESNMRREYPEGLKIKSISEKMIKKLYDSCNICGKTAKKNELVELLAKTSREKWDVPYGYMCRECFEKHCEAMNVNPADVYAKADRKETEDEEKLQKK